VLVNGSYYYFIVNSIQKIITNINQQTNTLRLAEHNEYFQLVWTLDFAPMWTYILLEKYWMKIDEQYMKMSVIVLMRACYPYIQICSSNLCSKHNETSSPWNSLLRSNLTFRFFHQFSVHLPTDSFHHAGFPACWPASVSASPVSSTNHADLIWFCFLLLLFCLAFDFTFVCPTEIIGKQIYIYIYISNKSCWNTIWCSIYLFFFLV
jgi:hypothetical protein